VLREDHTEVEIKESIDDIDDLNVNIDGFDKGEDVPEGFFGGRPARPLSEEEELVDLLFDGDAEIPEEEVEGEELLDDYNDNVDDLIDEELNDMDLDDED
jgi:DNA-directed RNA polymerase subunit beta